ncbi:hypothetical protein [Selenomonas ruminantium]|uniref:Uncharacterized protein n=1 Tax=Selenomonas ruminantium TaxID=971 RepID=A0A1H4A7Z4_SELRU|nr:hypothetical protein [Selenomonas ruminantium]SEA31574.1 hypothetical protein SAMN05660648_02759 [Selenomonas ruminantium]
MHDENDDSKRCVESEIYMLNQDYGMRSGCLWGYEYKDKSVILYPHPWGVDGDAYYRYVNAYKITDHKKDEEIALSGYMYNRKFASEEEALAYIDGVKKGIDLMIESILGANSKVKMIF